MSDKDKEYYTAGELANLFNLPKQTLLYYDKMGILIPEFISENNYRHYSLKQYLTLEIIVNLRKLDIPISKIKEYINNKSPENFSALLKDKEAECYKTIKENEKVLNNLHIVFQQLHKVEESRLEQITLNFRSEKYFFISKLDPQLTGSEIINIFAKHNLKVFSKDHFKERATGWILSKENFFAGNCFPAKSFFSTVNPNYHKTSNYYVRPAGLYITMRFKGTFYQRIKDLKALFQSFMEKNNLIAIGDLYVMPLKNHWLTADAEEYINQISMSVEYNEKNNR